MWRYVPDWLLKKILLSAGAPTEFLNGRHTAAILKQFRRDTDFAIQVFSVCHKKIDCAISIIVGKNDFLTMSVQTPTRLWKKYAKNILRVTHINTSTHYFQSENSDLIAQLILTK